MARGQDFITLARQHNKAIWDGINALVAMQREWQALDYGNTLPDGCLLYTLRPHETPEHLVCRLLLEKKKRN